MVRPKKNRCIQNIPVSTFYKPRGIALHDMQGITLSLEGLEAIRLVDAEGTSRGKAARMMGISTPTLCRILAEARSTVAKALANGWALRIEGGNYTVVDRDYQETGGLGQRQRHRRNKRRSGAKKQPQ